ncbi:MAG: hypothetical protein KGZ85_15630 [Ignavibacterium sp.]|nr:hypothetical protein [Ignavibacterium sp.]
MIENISLVEVITLLAVLLTLYWTYQSRKAKKPKISRFEPIYANDNSLQIFHIYIVNTQDHNIFINNVFIKKNLFLCFYGRKKKHVWDLKFPSSRQQASFIKDEGLITLNPPDKILYSKCKFIIDTNVGKCSRVYVP